MSEIGYDTSLLFLDSYGVLDWIPVSFIDVSHILILNSIFGCNSQGKAELEGLFEWVRGVKDPCNIDVM